MFIPPSIQVSVPSTSSKNPKLRSYYAGEFDYLKTLITDSSKTSKSFSELRLHFSSGELGENLDINDTPSGQLHLFLCACARETYFAAAAMVEILGLKIDFTATDHEGKSALMFLFAKRRIPVILCQEIFKLLLQAKIKISIQELAVLEKRASEREIETAIELLASAKNHNSQIDATLTQPISSYSAAPVVAVQALPVSIESTIEVCDSTSVSPPVKRARTTISRAQRQANEDSRESVMMLSGHLEIERGKILALQRSLASQIACLGTTAKLLEQIQKGDGGNLLADFQITVKLEEHQGMVDELMDSFKTAQVRYDRIKKLIAELDTRTSSPVTFSSSASRLSNRSTSSSSSYSPPTADPAEFALSTSTSTTSTTTVRAKLIG